MKAKRAETGKLQEAVFKIYLGMIFTLITPMLFGKFKARIALHDVK